MIVVRGGVSFEIISVKFLGVWLVVWMVGVIFGMFLGL